MHIQILHTVSRMVWQNNVKLANFLVSKCKSVSALVRVANNRVLLKDPNQFSLKFAQAKMDAITKAMAHHQKMANDSTQPVKLAAKSKDLLAKLARVAKNGFL